LKSLRRRANEAQEEQQTPNTLERRIRVDSIDDAADTGNATITRQQN
jgi:hypothetical protein